MVLLMLMVFKCGWCWWGVVVGGRDDDDVGVVGVVWVFILWLPDNLIQTYPKTQDFCQD